MNPVLLDCEKHMKSWADMAECLKQYVDANVLHNNDKEVLRNE